MTLNPAVKRRNRRVVLIAAIAALSSAVFAPPSRALSDRILHDSYTGIAIGGFDPVAYFLEGRAAPGDPALEVVWGGAYWRFANPGNAAAFEDAPSVYAPAYGGYGVVGIARGVPQPGDPRLFAVYRNRLFFFYALDDLRAFRDDPGPLIAAADDFWPRILTQLAD
ncbi:MAG TPA: YHS domain-containing (seleno)protein [Methylomirabilota bacterium]|nr:YHS domain-containing (seleno)protein [Methylomirabilota bacterium]